MVMEPQSIIIVVSWKNRTHSASIIRLETPPPPPPPPVPDASPLCDDAAYYPPCNYGAFYPPRPCAPPPPLPEVQLFQTGFSAKVPFFPELLKWDACWHFSTPPSRSPEDLYMLPDWMSASGVTKKPLPGIIFNLRTKKCTLITPPRAPKYSHGYAITMVDHIYYMAVPYGFERYDTISQSWEDLEPLNPLSCKGHIIGYAVLDDTILFCMSSGDMRAYNVNRNKWYTVKVLDGECNSIEGEAVVVNNIIYALTFDCESLVALTLITSQEENDNDGDLVYTCDLLKEYVVPGMAEIKFKFQEAYRWSRHLVHLGKDNFCVVRTCALRHSEYHDLESQYIQLTYIEVSEKKSIVTNYCVHDFKIPISDSLDIIRCFSMPDCKSNALKEATRLINPAYPAEVVTLPPELHFLEKYAPTQQQFLEKYAPTQQQFLPKYAPIQQQFLEKYAPKQQQFLEKYSSQTNTFAKQGVELGTSVHADTNKSASVVYAKSNVPSNASTISASGYKSSIYAIPSSATKASALGDVDAYERSNTDEEGGSICVLNLPHDFTYIQLEKELNKFGPMKGVKIHHDFNHMECWVADVEFESLTSKQNAIKASTLTIRGRNVVIEKKKGTGLAPGDSNSNRTSGGSSSGLYKVKNHGENYVSKRFSGGAYAKKKSPNQHVSKRGPK